MLNSNDFEAQLRKLISETQDELNKTNEQLKAIEEKRTSLNDELQSYEYSLHSYLKRIGKEDNQKASSNWDEILKHCKTHKERILTIAEHNNDTIKFNSMVDIIYNGKHIQSKSRANAYVLLYGIVQEMVDKGLLKKTKKATYKLVRPAGQLF